MVQADLRVACVADQIPKGIYKDFDSFSFSLNSKVDITSSIAF